MLGWPLGREARQAIEYSFMDRSQVTGDRPLEVRVPDHVWSHQLNLAVEPFSSLLNKSEIPVRHGRRDWGIELREEVDIAVLGFLPAGHRSENGEPFDSKAFAKGFGFVGE